MLVPDSIFNSEGCLLMFYLYIMILSSCSLVELLLIELLLF